MFCKSGQGAGGAAVLIGAIAGLMLLYILFLPPDERSALIGENNSRGVQSGIGLGARTLLSESPGTVTASAQSEFDHRINSFNIFEKSEDSILKSFDSAYVESRRGSSKRKVFAFSADKSKTSNPQLSFDVKSGKGRLIVAVNGEEVFNGEAQGQVNLRIGSLEKDNVVEFAAEEVGFQFWRTNGYELSDIKVTATVELLENLESRQTFIIGKDEIENIDSAYMIYFVDCQPFDVGRLQVYLNDVLLSVGVPDCQSPVRLNMDPALLVRGSNNVRFIADKGSYLVDRISVKTKLREPVEPVYFFEVNATQYSWLVNKSFKAELRMKFVDDNEQKRAELNINNRRTFMDAKRTANFTKDITSFLVEGNNFIRVVPETTLHIADLRIELRQ